MTEPTTKPKGTAVETRPDLEAKLLAEAKTPEERQLAYELASRARQADMIRNAALHMAETGWGKEISPVARAAVVRYCFEIGADPLGHVYVLGGNIYLNARFWMDLVAANPKFLRDEVHFIHQDKRADDAEQETRRLLRVQYGVPEEAPGAAIVTLHYEGRGPFIGVNWAGVRAKDPVGKEEPTKTAQTRAYRKAAMKAEPAWFKSHPGLEAAEEVITTAQAVAHQEAPQLPSGDAPVETKAHDDA